MAYNDLTGSVQNKSSAPKPHILNAKILDEIFGFWFDQGAEKRWFEGNPRRRSTLDREISDKFGTLLTNIEEQDEKNVGEMLSSWSSLQLAAAIIVLDQFSR